MFKQRSRLFTFLKLKSIFFFIFIKIGEIFYFSSDARKHQLNIFRREWNIPKISISYRKIISFNFSIKKFRVQNEIINFSNVKYVNFQMFHKSYFTRIIICAVYYLRLYFT